MDKYLPVKENSDYVQDPDNYALLFCNEKEFQAYDQRLSANKRLENLENQIGEIFNILNEMKSLIRKNNGN